MPMNKWVGRAMLAAVVTVLLAPAAARAVTTGLVDNFASGTNGWGSSTGVTNPGAGGVGGAGDGFLRIANSFFGNFGAMSTSPSYIGDWTGAGVTDVSFHLNDVDADQNFSFRFLVSTPGGSAGTTWQYNTGLNPPNGSWQQYTINLSDESQWTRLRGTDSLAQVLANVGTAHFRHDVAPYFSNPDPIQGEIGIDNITLIVPEPSAACGLALLLLPLRRKRS